MIAAKEDATQIAPRVAVKPGHRVFEATVAFATEVKKVGQRLKWDGFGVDPGTSNRTQLQIRPGDYSGEAKASDRGAKHPLIFLWAANHEPFIRAKQAELMNVSAEGSRTMVVLPVDVVGNCPADGDKTCPRSNWQ